MISEREREPSSSFEGSEEDQRERRRTFHIEHKLREPIRTTRMTDPPPRVCNDQRLEITKRKRQPCLHVSSAREQGSRSQMTSEC